MLTNEDIEALANAVDEAITVLDEPIHRPAVAASLLKAAAALRQLAQERENRGLGCACRFDDEDNQIKWCGPHIELKNECAAHCAGRAGILSALGEHPEAELDIAERIGQIRDEGRAHFHNYTKLLMERDQEDKLLRAGCMTLWDARTGYHWLMPPAKWEVWHPDLAEAARLAEEKMNG